MDLYTFYGEQHQIALEKRKRLSFLVLPYTSLRDHVACYEPALSIRLSTCYRLVLVLVDTYKKALLFTECAVA